MTIRSLELRARAVVEGFGAACTGVRITGSRSSSPSTASTPGRRSALSRLARVRADRPLFHQEIRGRDEPPLHLLVDQSRSMDYGSRGYTKAPTPRRSRRRWPTSSTCRATRSGLLTFDEKVREYLPARHRAGTPAPADARPGAAGGAASDGSRRADRTHLRPDPQARHGGADLRFPRAARPPRKEPHRADRGRPRGRPCFRCSIPRNSTSGSRPAAVRGRRVRAHALHRSRRSRGRATRKNSRPTARPPGDLPQARHQLSPAVDRQALELALFEFLQERMRRGRIVRRAARRGGRTRMNFLTPLFPARWPRDRRPDSLSPGPPHDAGAHAVQLAHVSAAEPAAALQAQRLEHWLLLLLRCAALALLASASPGLFSGRPRRRPELRRSRNGSSCWSTPAPACGVREPGPPPGSGRGRASPRGSGRPGRALSLRPPGDGAGLV
jgi:hypothetical protein